MGASCGSGPLHCRLEAERALEILRNGGHSQVHNWAYHVISGSTGGFVYLVCVASYQLSPECKGSLVVLVKYEILYIPALTESEVPRALHSCKVVLGAATTPAVNTEGGPRMSPGPHLRVS